MAPAGLPEEQLHKILQQIQAQAINSQRQLSMVKAQIASKDREKRMHALIRKQLDEEAAAPGTSAGRTYRSVGKMFIAEERDVLVQEEKDKEKESDEEIVNLSKKQKFLEKQFSDAQAHLRDFFSGMEKQQAA